MTRRRPSAPCPRCADTRAMHEALDLRAVALHAELLAMCEDMTDTLRPPKAKRKKVKKGRRQPSPLPPRW